MTLLREAVGKKTQSNKQLSLGDLSQPVVALPRHGWGQPAPWHGDAPWPPPRRGSHGVSVTLGLMLLVTPASGQFLGTSREGSEGQGWITPGAPCWSLFSGGNCQDKIRSRLNFIYDLN